MKIKGRNLRKGHKGGEGTGPIHCLEDRDTSVHCQYKPGPPETMTQKKERYKGQYQDSAESGSNMDLRLHVAAVSLLY